MTPDLKQLTDLVREMRDVLVRTHSGLWCAYRGKPLTIAYTRSVSDDIINAVARADALIGPGDGFQEVERLNEGAESE